MKRSASYLLILLGLGTILHLFFLNYPNQVIFDEVHFGKFVTAYCCTGQRFFDIHPPLAKLMIAGTAKALGYQGGFDFDHIGEPFGAISVFALRFWPALSGILLPLIFFVLLRQLGVSEPGAFVGGLALVLDNAILVQTRVIALDGTLLLASMGAVSAWLAVLHGAARWRWMYVVLAGIAIGFSVGTKFTGLAIPALLVIVTLVELFRSGVRPYPRLNYALYGVSALVLAGVIYFGGWALHFWLLQKPGSGDVWGVPTWTSPLISSFFANTFHLQQQMISANYNLQARHPDESVWWQWLVMKKPVYYWYGGPNSAIYFIGNPVVWWGSTLLLLTALLSSVRRFFKDYWLPLVGYLLAYVPLMRIPRALFMYHYLTPLLFAVIISIMWFDRQANGRKTWYQAATLLLLIGWIIMAPFTYGFVTAPSWFNALTTIFLR